MWCISRIWSMDCRPDPIFQLHLPPSSAQNYSPSHPHLTNRGIPLPIQEALRTPYASSQLSHENLGWWPAFGSPLPMPPARARRHRLSLSAPPLVRSSSIPTGDPASSSSKPISVSWVVACQIESSQSCRSAFVRLLFSGIRDNHLTWNSPAPEVFYPGRLSAHRIFPQISRGFDHAAGAGSSCHEGGKAGNPLLLYHKSI